MSINSPSSGIPLLLTNLSSTFTHSRSASLAIRTTALECCTQASILMRQVEDMLRQAGRLDYAAHLDRALFFDEFPHRVKQIGREL
nr:hypothetical protein CFP56_10475 [Quercus suber]